ncbi:MAG: response regulator [Saprospiraceae bacterium]|nr:response regulator [Saprospiraceae bacterium]
MPYQEIRYIHQDKDGLFWLAANGLGLIRWNRATGEYRVFTPKDGLSHHTIHAIYEDQSGYFWMPSNQGLIRFNTKNYTTRTFYKQDGLPSDEFNYLAHFQDQDGLFYFGTVDGLVSFHPNKLRNTFYEQPRLCLVAASNFDGITRNYTNELQGAIKNKTIVLKPHQKFTTLEVSALIYKELPNVEYGWMLDEMKSGDWVIQKENIIRLDNLSYGEHQIKIKVRIVGNEWSNKTIDLKLIVERPIYLRWWFIMAAILLVIGLVINLFRMRIHYLRTRQKVLEREIAKRTLQIHQDKRTIEEQAAALKSLDELKSNFFTNVTHELKTPLTLLIAPLQEILSTKEINPFVKSKIKYAIQNAEQLLQLTEEILDLSKLEQHKLELLEKDVALFPFLSRIITAYQPYAQLKNIDLQFEYTLPHQLILLIDEGKCQKIINNLFSNALKFCTTGNTVTLRAEVKEQYIQLQVIDDGIGIHQEDIPFIFQRYFQSKQPSRNLKGGTGIGLALSKEYAHLMQGDLTVESEWKKGSLFTFSFPMKLGRANEKLIKLPTNQHTQENNTALGTFKYEQIQTILVVEDSFDMLTYIKSVLAEKYQVFQASNGKIAIQVLEEHSIDLVISDMMMPEMDGLQLLDALRLNRKWSRIPFIMLTARTELADKLQALRLGVDDYLNKPFIVEELLARVHNLLEHASSRKIYMHEKVEEQITVSFNDIWLRQLETVVLTKLSDSKFDVKKMAEEMNISERNLRDKVKTYTGISPAHYLKEARLSSARQLIETKTYHTVAEVAHAVGFENPSYFSRIFKERFGRLPSDILFP